MSNLVRILIAIACIIALYYLVVVLARGVAEQDASSPAPPGLEEQSGRNTGLHE